MAICSARLSSLRSLATRSVTAAWHSSQVTALEAETVPRAARARTRNFMMRQRVACDTGMWDQTEAFMEFLSSSETDKPPFCGGMQSIFRELQQIYILMNCTVYPLQRV